MIIHENGKTYRIQLRGAYAHIKSEKKFREMIEASIAGWEKRSPAYGKALRRKSLWEINQLFGIISQKTEIK